MAFVIKRKRVKFPTYQPRSGLRWVKPTMEEEVDWQDSRYSTRATRVRIGGVEFRRITGWTGAGQGLNIDWGWIYPLYNMAKAMRSMGYKDFVENSSMHGDFRYGDINESVLNLIHIMFKDYKIPHIIDSMEDEEEESLALPLITQLQSHYLTLPSVPTTSPVILDPPSP